MFELFMRPSDYKKYASPLQGRLLPFTADLTRRRNRL
jgi:hypothetical protein